MRALITEKQIQDRIEQMAIKINERFKDVPLLYMIVVLRGGCFFGIDLAKRLNMPVRLDYIRVTTYSGNQSSGVVSLVSDIKTDIAGQPVLVVDDIVDTGFTMEWILRYLELKRPGQVKVAALLDKPARREFPVKIDFLGFSISDVFVAGYGLDGLDDTKANIPYIVSVEGGEGQATVPPEQPQLPDNN
ncbi:MAG: hypoxanthine phosphoribosyltransferase [Chloroflexota bacterium]